MKLPSIKPEASWTTHGTTTLCFTPAQIRQLQHDTAEAVLKVVYETSNAYGKPGECMWIGVKARVRHALKELK